MVRLMPNLLASFTAPTPQKQENATQISQLISSLKKSKNLKTLDLSNKLVSSEELKDILDAVKYSEGLTTLNLSKCELGDDSRDSLVEYLELNPSLQEIVLDGNNFRKSAVKVLVSTIVKSQKKLQRLSLNGLKVDDAMVKEIAKIATLKTLAVANGEISASAAKYLVEKMELEQLDISSNKVGSKFFRSFSKRSPMRILRADNCELKADDLPELSILSALESLSIGNNGLQNSMQYLPTLFNNCENLFELSFAGSKLSNEDIATLGEWLASAHCTLKSLILSQCSISNSMMAKLSKSLGKNHSLTDLDLSSNDFGAIGTTAFCHGIRQRGENKNSRGKSLEVWLTGNRIEIQGENELAELVEHTLSNEFNVQFRSVGGELEYINNCVSQARSLVGTMDGDFDGLFVTDGRNKIISWSNLTWTLAKRGPSRIVATVIKLIHENEKVFKSFTDSTLFSSRNVVNQTLFEHILRHSPKGARCIDTVVTFVNMCGVNIDTECSSKASVAMAKEKRKSDDVTYRIIMKTYCKDPAVVYMAMNMKLLLDRYLVDQEYTHKTDLISRSVARDTKEDHLVYVQIYKEVDRFKREVEAREVLVKEFASSGPFKIYDMILRESELHPNAGYAESAMSFFIPQSLSDMRNSISNLGITAGFDITKMVQLTKLAAQKLGTLNNLGRIHGDFRPRNFLQVAPERKDTEGEMLPEKWVLFDLSSSVKHGEPVVPVLNGYMPPEVARVTFNAKVRSKALPPGNEKMDVWQFGVVLYTLLTGYPLFHLDSSTDAMLRHAERVRLVNWINLDSERLDLVLHRASEAQFESPSTFKKIKASSSDLVQWCLQGDPLNRPTFAQILSHPFFTYKTHVDYTDVDLLLGWYNKNGMKHSLKHMKNDRTHFHVVGDTAKFADVTRLLDLGFKKNGCTYTTDGSDVKLDVKDRKLAVTRSRALILLAHENILNESCIKKIIWAMDSPETDRVLFLDCSDRNAFTGLDPLDLDSFLNKRREDPKELDAMIDTLFPIEEKLGLDSINYPSIEEHGVQVQRKWLKEFVLKTVFGYMDNQRAKMMPFRTLPFQRDAMVAELVRRAGFYPSIDLAATRKQEEKHVVNVLLISNRNAAAKEIDLLAKNLETDNHRVDVIKTPAELRLALNLDQEKVAKPTLLYLIVSPGVYKLYEKEIPALEKLSGPIGVVTVRYDSLDLNKLKDEIVDLGVDRELTRKLQDKKCYIPLTALEPNLEYETHASVEYLVRHVEVQREILERNKNKGEVWNQYRKSNFFQHIQ